MKKMVLALVFTVLLSAGSALNGVAQQKIGYINSDELIMSMPERDSAMNTLEQKRQDFLRQSEELQVEFNKKYEDYLMKQDSLSPLIRSTKENELGDLRDRIETFNAAADQELQRYQQEVFQPIIERAQLAIKEVATEQGFTYILDISRGSVIYFPEEGSENIMSAVRKKLGLE
ncbi:MAG: OmpH family outer membrane protein [Bacteroidota bacterium]|nr:OmpH family outer membrane protein [Bacteroidota bacterium]